MSNNTGNILTALLTGAAIGAGVGILYVPDKGKKTRKKIKKSAIKVKDDLANSIDHRNSSIAK